MRILCSPLRGAFCYANFIFWLLLLGFFSISSAATITLKSGQKIEAEIIEENGRYIKVDFSGVKLTFWRDEIRNIAEEKSQQAADYDFYFWAGSSLLKKGSYDQAIGKFKQAISYEPAAAGAYHNLAVAYGCKGDYSQAIDLFGKALQREKGDYVNIIRYNLATAYFYAGDIDRAKKIVGAMGDSFLITLLSTIIAAKEEGSNVTLSLVASSFPPDTVLLAPQPSSQAGKERVKNLQDELDEKIYIVEDFPLFFFYRSPLSYLRLAISLMEQEKWPQAKTYLSKAESLLEDRDSHLDEITLGGVYLYRGKLGIARERYVDALEFLKKGSKLFPQWHPFYESLGYVYYMLGDSDLARENLNKALDIVGKDSEEGAEIKKKLQRIEEDKNEAMRSFKEIEDESEARQIRALVLRAEQAYARHDLDALMGCMDMTSSWVGGMRDTLREEFSRFPYTRIYTEEVDLKIGELEEGLAAYLTQDFLFISFNDEGNIHNEFRKFYILGKRKGSEDWKIVQWRQIVRDDFAYYLEAMKFFSQGKLDQAIKKFNECLAVNPNYSLAYLRLSEIYYKRIEMTKAIQYARKACEVRPDVAYYYYFLGLIYRSENFTAWAREAFSKARDLDADLPNIDSYLDEL